jgi:hypothetical protein
MNLSFLSLVDLNLIYKWQNTPHVRF